MFTREELIEKFDITDVNRSASTFNPEKLIWLNQHWLKESDLEQISAALSWHLNRLDVVHEAGPDLARMRVN